MCIDFWPPPAPIRALLYGGMKESQPQAEVRLEETRAEAFSMLLNYLYTGRASLSSAREEVLLDFLGLAHRYGLQPLEDSTSEFLRTVLHTNNVCLVFDVASLYSLSALSAACCAYMDRHGPEVLNSDGFLQLSKVRGWTGLQRGVGRIPIIWFSLTLRKPSSVRVGSYGGQLISHVCCCCNINLTCM